MILGDVVKGTIVLIFKVKRDKREWELKHHSAYFHIAVTTY